ncbi:AMP-binding protein [Pyruvatibacter mobilis]|uniref:class I adenylate-forming enzyme family protein n=1 Tax=Pyruvatibacter mobilis TaxID=1712261 RepID=UPI00041FBE1E
MSEAAETAAPEVPSEPIMSVADAHALMTSPGTPFAMEETEVRGLKMRVWKEAKQNLRELFSVVKDHGDQEFVVYEDDRMTYAEFHKAAIALSHILKDKYGVQKGDRVAIAMRNYPEWPIAFFAGAIIGAVMVPLNSWWTGEELEYGLEDSGTSIVFVDEERAFSITPFAKRLGIKSVIAARASKLPETDATVERFEDVLCPHADYAKLPEQDMPDVALDPEDDATIMYTSGTTGRPKGALGTQRNICGNVVGLGIAPVRQLLRYGQPLPDPENMPKRSMLLSVPLFHATGLHAILCGNLTSGNKLVMMFKWDPTRALELIEREKINSFGGVPAMVWQVVEHPDFDKYDTSSVVSVGYGGAPAAPELVQKIKTLFPASSAANGYGLTETSAASSQNAGFEYQAKPESCGPVLPVCDAKVVDENGNELPTGSVGELWIYGPNVVKGYWNKPEATAESFTDGWLHTGDLARIDEEGFIYILDRAKDMLIRGGENVYCVEVEDALYSHADVMDAAVIGIPHKVLGEEVGAVVQVTPGSSVTEGDLQTYVRQHLAAFKVPVKIELRTEPLPRNANGKILKRQLREEWGLV